MIWDLNIRIFHLMLIITVIISIISGKFSYFYIHEISGITLFFLILYRIYWGFFGAIIQSLKILILIRIPYSIILKIKRKNILDIIHLVHYLYFQFLY